MTKNKTFDFNKLKDKSFDFNKLKKGVEISQITSR